MRIRGSWVGGFLVLLLFTAAACSGGGPAGTTTVESTTSTAAATTTTTTLPPGLQPQQLAYGFGADELAKYDYTQTVTIDIPAGEGFGGLFRSSSSYSITAAGEMWQLTLPGSDGDTYEIVGDLRPDEATLDSVVAGLDLSDEYTEDDLAELVYLFVPVVVDVLGQPAEGTGGAPGYLRTAANPFDVLLVPGPPLTEETVDVGDTWTYTVDHPVLGPIEYRSDVVAEEEMDEGYAFSIDYVVEMGGFPLELTITEAAEIAGSTSSQQSLNASLLLGGSTLDLAVSIDDLQVSGTYLFDPAAGRVVESEATLMLVETINSQVEGFEGSVSVNTSATYSLLLSEAAAARDVERGNVLAAFKTDPYDLAYEQFNALWEFGLWEPDEDHVEALFDLIGYSGDVVAGVGYAEASLFNGESALVAVITTGGQFRGAPFLAQDLAAYWAGYNPAPVTVGDQTAYRFSTAGREWLMWGDRAYLFLVSGPRAISQEVMEAFVARPEPYLWQTGDCVSFEDDYLDEKPWAPYGIYGLRHCLDEHTYEVIYTEAVTSEPGDPYPDESLLERAYTTCGEVFYDYIGAFDLDTVISLSIYLPDEDEWAQGSRYLACLANEAGNGGEVSVEDRLGGAGPSNPVQIEAGDCLVDDFPVACNTAHNGEVVGGGEYDAAADDPMPDWDELGENLEDVCQEAFDDYGIVDGDFEVDFFWLSDMYSSWDLGARSYYCAARAYDEDGWPVDVVGSFADDWEEAPEQIET